MCSHSLLCCKSIATFSVAHLLLLKLFSFVFQSGCGRMLQKQLCRPDNISDKTCPVTFSQPKFIKAVQHKWYFIAECSFYGEYSPFWAGGRVCFKVHFSIYKPPTYFSSGSHQGHPWIIRQKWVQHRKSSDNLWEVG